MALKAIWQQAQVDVSRLLAGSTPRSKKSYIAAGEGGFTLLELLVAITIMAIMLAVASLAIPNHDERYWRDNLDQLTSSLNMAQEESLMTGMPILIQIDSVGWRFLLPTPNGPDLSMGNYGGNSAGNSAGNNAGNNAGYSVGSSAGNMAGNNAMMGNNAMGGNKVGIGGITNNTVSQSPLLGSNGLMPDVYQPQVWRNPVQVASMQLTLGGEQVTQALQIPLKQADRQATLIRDKNGFFRWVVGVPQ